MKIIFRTTLLIFFVLNVNALFSQNQNEKTVSITVSGSGKTQDEAKQSALRSAIEQAFGAFISAKTEILNDQIISDQITSIASGNIQSFEILNASQLTDSNWGVTLKAIVSIDKLSSFVEAKGVSVEIKGGLFALNIKQQILNEQAELKAISNMTVLLDEMMQVSFDYSIISEQPQSLGSNNSEWEIPLTVTATANKNIDLCANYFIKTLTALSLSDSEVKDYIALNKKRYPVFINYKNKEYTFNLRNSSSLSFLGYFGKSFEFTLLHFSIKTGIDELLGENIEFTWPTITSSDDFSRANLSAVHRFFDVYNERFKINFLSEGQIACKYVWSDKRSLNQIEKMTGYLVEPRVVISSFKKGGYIVFESDGHGLVVANGDIGRMNWNDAMKSCDELVLNGFNDWRLPTVDEQKLILKKLPYNYISLFKLSEEYWSSTSNENDNKEACSLIFYGSKSGDFNYLGKEYEYYVRPVRTY